MQVAVVVPAAGRGRRMGDRPKALLDYGGRSALDRIAATVLAAGLPPPVVVTGAHRDAVEAAARPLGLPIAHNEAWEAGRTGSVQVGWRAAGALPALLWPVDVPLVKVETVRALARRAAATAAVPLVGERRGHPALLGLALREEVLALPPDAPLNVLLQERARQVPLDDEGALLNVNTPEDHARALRYLEGAPLA